MSRYSLDWRFLLPVLEHETFYILGGPDADLSRAFVLAGLRVAELSTTDLQDASGGPLPCVVLPRGLPATREDPAAAFSSIRRLIAPGGFLLVGFNNVWNRAARARSEFLPSTPQRAEAHLRRAGFHAVRLFGAMPNLAVPEYIFDLEARATGFALQNRFRRKRAVLGLLHLVGRTAGWQSLTRFLPCYFAVATA